MKYGKLEYYIDIFLINIRTTVYKAYAARTLFLVSCLIVAGILFYDANAPAHVTTDICPHVVQHSRLLLYTATVLILSMFALISSD